MKIQSATPRTDSLCFKETMQSAEVVLATFARDLERRLDASKAEIEKLKLQRDRALEIAADYVSEGFLAAEMEDPVLQYPPTTPTNPPTP